MKRNKCARKKYKMYSDRKAIVKLEVANNICNNKKKKNLWSFLLEINSTQFTQLLIA